MGAEAAGKAHLIDGKYAIGHLVDLGHLHTVFEKFTKATGFTIGILDHPGLNTLVATGWRDICTKFHRPCRATATNCTKSNRHLMNQLNEPRKVVIEPCENGLVDCATPIIVKGKHIASLFTGQILLEKPDMERFKRQAKRFGFDEAEYLNALRAVPIISEDKVKDMTEFLGEMALIVSQLGYSKLLIKEEATRLEDEIARREQSEEALRKSEESYRLLADNVSDVIWTRDMNLRFTYLSPSVARLTGYTVEEALQKPVEETYTPASLKAAMKVLAEELAIEEMPGVDPDRTRIVELEGYCRDGSTRWNEAKMCFLRDEGGRPVGIMGVSRDITERKKAEKERDRLQAQLLQAQKMEAVGTLAGGIAHDFNNLLQAIMGYTQIIKIDKPQGDRDFGALWEIEKAVKRASRLTQQLLTFSRKVKSRLRPMDLNQVVVQVQELIKRTIPKMIDIELHLLKRGLKVINADPAQVEQILMNLSVNARDAMPDGGKLVIETENTILDETFCKKHLGAETGKYVLLTVSDTGRGMDKQTLDHIFEPFYTTKEIGKGTGLGLAMVYGIVKSHGGYIVCDSDQEKGTTFRIYFPAIETESRPEEAEREEEGNLSEGKETILLVDDEETLRDLGKKMLERFGYTVLLADNGERAIEIYREEREAISLIILDLIMPGMGGRKCLEELHSMGSEIKVIIASGYSVDPPTRETLDALAKGFISKPYELRQMLKMVREVLDQR